MMGKNKKTIVLNEYRSLFKIKKEDTFECGYKDEKGNVALEPKLFDKIDCFIFDVAQDPKKQKRAILTRISENENNEQVDILKRGRCKVNGVSHSALTAQSFVGVIVTEDGTTIEILPKISTEDNENEVRKTFLKMLRSLRQSPDNKIFDQASLSSTKMHLLEIFVDMFCREVENLIRKGLKSDYVVQNMNEFFLKGKLDLKKHLQHNFVHKERFFVAFDEYVMDTPENRLIKTTIDLLFNKTRSGKNKKRLREMKFVFNEVEVSKDIRSDFMHVKDDRTMRSYKLVLQWCRVFLAQESFTSFYGKNIAFALLFDMNKVFEDYVAHCLRQREEYESVTTQQSGESLIEYRKSKFYLRPDLFLYPQNNEARIIADTKWKLITNDAGKKWGISQSDIYQMFAYGKKFDCKQIQLIYPRNKDFEASEAIEKMYFKYNELEKENNFSLDVLCFDCALGEIV